MSDNVVHWPDEEEEDPTGPRLEPDHGPPEWLRLEEALKRAPGHLRASIQRLAECAGGPPSGDAVRGADWRGELGLEEAWQAVGFLREALIEARRAPPDALPTEHARLDGALLGVADEELSRAADAQRRLLEEVSHDLRSPLNSILFLADALRAEQSGPLNHVQERQVGVLYTAAVTLVKMVNDLIDFARLGTRERIRVAESSFSVESVLADVTNLVGPLVTHRGIELRTEVRAEGLRSGDPQLLSRVLLNLVSNAVQAVDEGGHVNVHVSESDDGHLKVEVADDRVGTDVEGLRHLLEAAERGALPGETRGWTRGLGLSISARLIRVAGGEITVCNLKGEGTVFTVTLPFPGL